MGFVPPFSVSLVNIRFLFAKNNREIMASHVVLVGPAHPPAECWRVVLIHGWLGNHKAWIQTAQYLHEKYGHSVLVPDLAGWGDSKFAHVDGREATESGFCTKIYSKQVFIYIETAGFFLHSSGP